MTRHTYFTFVSVPYQSNMKRSPCVVSHHGYNHIAFEVPNVEVAADAVVAAGGSRLGEIVDFESPSEGVITFVFLRDPEDNIVQLVHYPE